MFYVQKHMTPLGVCSGLPLIRDKPPGAPAFVRLTFFYYPLSSSLLSSSPAFLRCSSLAIIHHQNCLTNHHQQRSRLRHPISKIRMILLMDAKIWIISLIIMFAVHPICAQDAIFKMSSVSPDQHKSPQLIHLRITDMLFVLHTITVLLNHNCEPVTITTS